MNTKELSRLLYLNKQFYFVFEEHRVKKELCIYSLDSRNLINGVGIFTTKEKKAIFSRLKRRKYNILSVKEYL
ncbi:hypothetical protein ABID30_003269 [Enterococcus rotai]|uniref:hypothetical protein n=1 Tax=Enterococcus rotai TaxID=118060 RepID=UPI0033971BE6